MKLLVYTFFNPGHLTYKVVKSLPSNINKYYLGDISSLTKGIIQNKYTHILGLGDYRKNSKKIRFETKFTNRYGKKTIFPNGQKYYSSTWNFPLSDTNISDKASNGPCNRSAYLISKTISDNNLKTKFAFIHIPTSFDFDQSKKIIEEWLNEV